MRWLALVGLAGCGGGASDTDALPTGGTPTSCEAVATGEITGRELYGTANGPYDLSTLQGEIGRAFIDEVAYLDFQAEIGLTLPVVDFAVEQVVASWWFNEDSCAVTLEGWRILEQEGGPPVLEATFEDVSRECPTGCGQPGYAVVVVAHPVGAAAGVCRLVQGGC